MVARAVRYAAVTLLFCCFLYTAIILAGMQRERSRNEAARATTAKPVRVAAVGWPAATANPEAAAKPEVAPAAVGITVDGPVAPISYDPRESSITSRSPLPAEIQRMVEVADGIAGAAEADHLPLHPPEIDLEEFADLFDLPRSGPAAFGDRSAPRDADRGAIEAPQSADPPADQFPRGDADGAAEAPLEQALAAADDAPAALEAPAAVADAGETPPADATPRAPSARPDGIALNEAETTPSEGLRSGPGATADEAAPRAAIAQPAPQIEIAPRPQPPPRRLTPQMAALRDRVREVVRNQFAQPFDTTTNSTADLLHQAMAFGAKSAVGVGGAQGRRFSTIGSLCYNYPCRGYSPITEIDGHFAFRTGYGYQAYPSQMLAVLAFARVSSDYPLRRGDQQRTVADLIEHEKQTCQSGADMSLKLLGLAYYLPEGAAWQCRDGQTWSVERLLQEELDRPTVGDPAGSVQRLLGISYALSVAEARNQPLKGQYARAAQHLREFQRFALRLQNSDGSWHPRYFEARGASQNPAAALRSTGHILQWLAFSLPVEELEEPAVVRAVHYVAAVLASERFSYNVPALPSRDIAAAMTATHALVIYDARVFQPADPPREMARQGAASMR